MLSTGTSFESGPNHGSRFRSALLDLLVIMLILGAARGPVVIEGSLLKLINLELVVVITFTPLARSRTVCPRSALTFILGLEARPDVARRRMQTRQNRILDKGDIMKSRDGGLNLRIM